MCITKIFGLFAVNKKLTTMKSLTNKEEEIMNHYWDNGEMQIRQLQALYDDPKPHVNTLSTLVHILEDKGFLSHRNLKTRTYAYFRRYLVKATSAVRLTTLSISSSESRILEWCQHS